MDGGVILGLGGSAFLSLGLASIGDIVSTFLANPLRVDVWSPCNYVNPAFFLPALRLITRGT